MQENLFDRLCCSSQRSTFNKNHPTMIANIQIAQKRCFIRKYFRIRFLNFVEIKFSISWTNPRKTTCKNIILRTRTGFVFRHQKWIEQIARNLLNKFWSNGDQYLLIFTHAVSPRKFLSFHQKSNNLLNQQN